jgi:hypothetical protein
MVAPAHMRLLPVDRALLMLDAIILVARQLAGMNTLGDPMLLMVMPLVDRLGSRRRRQQAETQRCGTHPKLDLHSISPVRTGAIAGRRLELPTAG